MFRETFAVRIADGGNHTYGRSHDLFPAAAFRRVAKSPFQNTERVCPALICGTPTWELKLFGLRTIE